MITLQKKSEFCILRVTSDIHISGKALEITKLIILYIKKNEIFELYFWKKQAQGHTSSWL